MQVTSKKISAFLSIVFFSFLLINAQNNTNSPYSKFGVGDIFRKPFGASRAMGGTSIGLRIPNSINFFNPASYSSQDSLSFVFDFGLRYNYTTFTTTEEKDGIFNLNMDHVAISFPITKWWYASAGVFPYSNVGYRIHEQKPAINATYYYNGSGGLNQFYIGSSFSPVKNLSIGINFSSIFGSIEYTRSVFYNDAYYTTSEEKKSIYLRNASFNYGVQYTYERGKNQYTLGIILDSKTKLKAREDIILTNMLNRIYINYNSDNYIDDYIYDTISNIKGQKGSIILPANIGIGLSMNHDNKLIFGIDYSTQQWSKYTLMEHEDSLQNSHLFNVGIQYTPNQNSIKGYIYRVNYRAGFHYYVSNLILRNTNIVDYSFSFGLGLPLRNKKSKINITYEIGKKGTINNGLIQEDFHIISLSLTLYEKWFFKSKFD